MTGENILITGMAGSIGSELLRQLAPNNKIYGVDINETGLFNLVEEYQQKGFDVHGHVMDIKDKEAVADLFAPAKQGYYFTTVFHTAARKHVTPMEQTPMEAVLTNIHGTYHLVREAKQWQVPRFVYISTDKVVNAKSIMGQTKKLGEMMVRNEGYVAVRFGNVLGSQGSVIPIWQKQMDEGKPLTVTDERMMRYMMSIEDAVGLVITAAEEGKPGECLILDLDTKKVNVLNLAKTLLASTGIDGSIRIIGARPGEVLSEELMTTEERANAVKRGKFFIL